MAASLRPSTGTYFNKFLGFRLVSEEEFESVRRSPGMIVWSLIYLMIFVIVVISLLASPSWWTSFGKN
jgi:hypothetical protein